ncbi:hypothetical protein Salat_2554100 [Sesamum alatum]|uniref:Uncharacterized protein n=1 Tax=Sesamum alatum TaxID=300844 RepID=A0AAE1XSI2_9LAMI|nr:hypothetical protein Salat_2554100 [Sesamum alatum]
MSLQHDTGREKNLSLADNTRVLLLLCPSPPLPNDAGLLNSWRVVARWKSGGIGGGSVDGYILGFGPRLTDFRLSLRGWGEGVGGRNGGGDGSEKRRKRGKGKETGGNEEEEETGR